MSAMASKEGLFHYGYNQTPEHFDINWRAIPFNRLSVVNLLLSHKPNAAYLEIGCDKDEMFNAVICSDKTGVDPRRGGTHRMTSDDFFKQNTRKFDVVFIDGLHIYEQVRRDILNSIACLKPGGWIALHDMFPLDWVEEHVPLISQSEWTGDVWKAAFELAQSKDIDFRLLKIDHGVGVFRLLKENPDIPDLRPQLSDKRFSYFYNHLYSLPLIDHDAGRQWMMEHL